MEFPDTGADRSAPGMPCTVTYIGYHAASRPDAAAVIVNGQTITYAVFYRDIAKMVLGLRGLGLEPGQVLAVEHPHFYLHWLILLACEALGITSFSYEEAEIPVLEKPFAMADLVMCRVGMAPPKANRVQLIDQAWGDTVLALAPELPIETVPLHADTPMRIVKSSGTTGRIKCMVQPHNFRERYLAHYQFRAGFNRESRFLVTMGFMVEPYNIYASDCARMGGVCIYDGRAGIVETVRQQSVTHLVLPPYILAQLLDNLPGDYVPAPNLIVIAIGAAVPKEVRERVKRVFAKDIVESYGAQEIAVVATMDEEGQGALLPGVEAEVVDDAGHPVLGQPGRVRVRAAVSVGGYIDDADATARMFRDGWFYPGDLAVMRDRRTLKIIGRVDDTLNIKGIKFAPGPAEEKLRSTFPVDDLCLTSLANAEGSEELCVVVVPGDAGNIADIQAALPTLVPANFGKVHVIAVPAIPRTATSKVRRAELNAILRRGDC